MKTHARHGFTLLEAMLMVVILSIMALGFGVSLQSSVRVPETVDNSLTVETLLVAKMEDLLTKDFATLQANSGLSDTVTIGNQTRPRTVTVVAADANGDHVPESDFLEVTVTINGQCLKRQVTQP